MDFHGNPVVKATPCYVYNVAFLKFLIAEIEFYKG